MATAAEISVWLASSKDAPKHLDLVLSYQTPEVRNQVMTAIRHYELCREDGGRLMPFEERQTVQSVNNHYGFAEPEVAERVFQALVDNSITTGLQQRMGTDDSRPPPEVTLRDNVEAALDLHSILDPLKE